MSENDEYLDEVWKITDELREELAAKDREIAIWKKRATQAAELLELRTEGKAREIAALLEALEAMRAKCEAKLRIAAADLPESYKRSKKKILEVADDIAALKGNGEGK
jgi:hypothetical protein